MTRPPCRRPPRAFTLIELLVVVSIISLLISIMMPSLSRARDQAKSVHCLARIKDIGNALAAYENVSYDLLPPAMWARTMPEDPQTVLANYGWAEILWTYVYKDEIRETAYFPAMRNVDPEKFEEYFVCKAGKVRGFNSGHYRVYLPAWSSGSYQIQPDGTFGDDTRPDPWSSTSRSSIKPKLPLLGDANEHSWAGHPCNDQPVTLTSFIDAGDANAGNVLGAQYGNRFSDRHYGGTNFLFQDLHATWEPRLRDKLAVDWDLNGVDDITIEE